MGLHQGVEQGLLAGEVAVKGPGSHSGVLYDLPQGGTLKSFIQELRQRSFLDFFQSCSGPRYNTADGSICQ